MAFGEIIGIDLGRTNSYSSVLKDGDPEIIPTVEGNKATPCLVAFPEEGKPLIGAPARRGRITNSEGTVASVREKLGRGQKVKIPTGRLEGSYTPEWIASLLLGKIKLNAERYLERPIAGSVISVPTYFDKPQRRATREAGKLAAFKEVRLIEEPRAAALAYGLDGTSAQTVLVYNLGRSAFAASVLEAAGGKLEVVSTERETDLGGRHFTQKIVKWLEERFSRREGRGIPEDSTTRQRLEGAAKEAKEELSTSRETTIDLPYITRDRSGPKHLEEKLIRAEFEEMVEGQLKRTVEVGRSALSAAKVRESEVDRVVLVGGSTRIPRVRELLEGLVPAKINDEIDPSEVIARGGALRTKAI